MYDYGVYIPQFDNASPYLKQHRPFMSSISEKNSLERFSLQRMILLLTPEDEDTEQSSNGWYPEHIEIMSHLPAA